jgi:plastocyanin
MGTKGIYSSTQVPLFQSTNSNYLTIFSNLLFSNHQIVLKMYTLPLLLSLLPLALAQYGNSGSAASTTASSAGAATTTASAVQGVTTVKVSNAKGDLTFTPDNFTAPVGQVIEFLFYPATHSVAQAAFATPCEPLANDTGFFSGAFSTSSGTNADVFTITVNDTKPIWFYCGYPSHCEAGMVGVINPP